MNRIIACLWAAALCLSFCGCGLFHEHTFYNHQVIEEPCGGMTGKMEKICLDCDETQIVDYPAESFLSGDSFWTTIQKLHDRLNAIGTQLCPGMTVQLRCDDWSAVTELYYQGSLFCQITYYDTDDYLNNPYPNQPMNGDMLNIYGIKYVNVLDFPNVPHAPNSFAAIAMTFDPLITQAQALELADHLAATRQSHYGNYLVTTINGVGYGHAYLMNQLQYSGSIVIRAGSEETQACDHDPYYEFTLDGVAYGDCSICGEFVGPINDSQWRYLTSMPLTGHSNSSPNGTDISVGNWEDPAGAVYWGAMKFWVVDQPGWSNTEYVEYTLDGSYSTLSGTLVAGKDSSPDAFMWIDIYLDGRLAYSTSKIGLYDYMTYVVDIQGVKTIRIACTTDTGAEGYGVVTAAVY